jgi:flavin reductase (DIM6/NTAB) family NADH-FMN oxidoreductase RutF
LVTVYNTDDLDSLLAGTNGALVVVTTASNDQRAGCLIGFHSQCSIEPVRFALWLSKANHTYRVSLFATHMAVHFVGQQDRELARLFGGTSGDRVDKFSLCEWTAGPGGVPLLTGCPDVMVLERLTSWDDGSDHVCFIGTPVTAQRIRTLDPLRLADAVRDIDAGHDAQERPVPNLTATTDC